MNPNRLILLFFLFAASLAYAQEVVYDKIGNQRLAIYIPGGYEESSEKFKTAYFYDGQASFTNNPYSWKVHEKITSLILEGKMDKLVAVGIYTDVDRTENLVPYYDPHVADKWGPYKARGNKFDDFIINSIVPYIEEHYKVIKEGKSRALIGMSFGGLHAMYTGLNNPGSFGLVAGISPSLWVDNYHFIKDTKKAVLGPAIWFDIGTAEWNHYIDAIDHLTNAGYKYGENLLYFEEDGAAHEPKYWVSRLEYPLILFAGVVNSEIVNVKVITEVITSSSSKKHFLRINPVATRADGIKFSLASQATYELTNPESGKVNEDGSFEIKQNYDMKVKVSYNDWEEEILIENALIRERIKE